MDLTLQWLAAAHAAWRHDRSRTAVRGDRGEGVISVAIAVLIMAFLGAAMWIGFQQMWKSTENTTNTKVQQIGNG
jgi:hypothetical protein